MAAAQTVLVTQLTGQAWIRGTDGNLTPIYQGMRIPADAVIVTASGGSVQLQADGQPPLIIGENQEVLLTADLVNPPQPEEVAIAAPPVTEIDQVIAAINAGQDPFADLDPTAAGLTGGSEGGSTFVRLASILENTVPLALAYENVAPVNPELQLFSGVGEALDDAQPVPANPQANADAGTVLEDGAGPLNGNVLANDTLGSGSQAQHQVLLRGGSGGPASSAQGEYGQLVLNTDGSYSYQLDNSLQSVQALAAGETRTENFTYTLVDGNGATSTSSLTITIVGTNDAPTLSGQTSAQAGEDALITVGGQLAVADVDASDTHSWSLNNNGQGQYGAFAVDASGAWTYVLNNASTQVQALAAGQQVTDTITVTVSDGQGGTATQLVTVTITGSNDDPTITGASTGAVSEDGITTVGGQLAVRDVDATDTHSWSLPNNGQGQYGSFTVDATGAWTYVLNNGSTQVQALIAGQQVTDTITVTVNDGQGGTATQLVTVTITGSNDSAVIGGAATGVVVEDGQLIAGGKLNVVDPDAGQAVFVAQNNVPTDYGNFTIGTDGTWTYSLDNNNPAVQALGAGQTLTETRTVVTADGTTANVVITINGTNDLPVLGSSVAAVTEDVNVVGGQLSTSGAVTISDIDSGDNSFQSTAVFNGTGSALGTLVFNTNGTYSYAVDNSKVQYLKTGESVVETYTVTSKDGSATTTITITINGADDGAVITPGQPGDDLGSVTEDGQLTAGGKLNVVDPDAGQAVFVAQNNVPTDYGNFTIGTDGTWSYNLDNNNPAVQALGAGQTLTETRTVVTADGTTANVVITINGTNDLPVLGSSVAAVTEDVNVVGGQLSTSGAVTISDIDSGDNSFQPTAVFNGAGTALGTLVFNTNGTYSYAVDNSKVQYLKTGESVVETYTVTSKDGSATTTITITINGADDGAVITPGQPGDDLGSVTEDGQLTAGGKLNVVDPDAGQAVFVAQNNVPTDYGNFTIGTDGTWSYNLDNNNPAVQALGAGQTLTETRTVVTADGTTANVVITINGTNDLPVLGSSVAAVTEDINVVGGQLSTSGAVTISDIDSGDNSFQANAVFNGTGSALGTLVFNTNGTYSYAVDNSKVQYLKTGESVVETYTVTSKDGSATTTITITINGADDGAVITPNVPNGDLGSVTEDGQLTAGGKLNVVDPDAGQAVFVAQNNVPTNYGNFTIGTDGTWSYNLDNNNPAVQALGAGQTLTETRTVVTADGTTANVVITINGTNDLPVLGSSVAAVTEDINVVGGQLSTSGAVTISDIDSGDNSFQPTAVFNGAGTALGTLVFNTNGTYSYAVDNSKVQYLKTGESVVETYTVTSKDGSATTTITITINGADDGAVITPNVPNGDLGSVTEDGQLTAGGKLNVVDPDAGQAVFVAQNVATPYGQFTIGTDGTWSYNLDNSNPAVQALGAGQTLTETRTVVTADGTTANVVITINGTNDLPVLGSSVAAVTEDVNVVGGQLSTSGAVTISDIDSGDNSFQATAVFNGTGSALGTLVFNTNGTYSYAVDNSKVQYLKTGESVVETYTVTSKDGSATTTITITINGADDGAVITPGQPGDDLGSVTEDGQLTAGGKLNVVDPDAGQAVFVAQNNVPTDYGNFTIGTDGTWSYNLDNNNPAVQALGAGQTLTETRTVVTADGTTANVVITINGTNDLPVLGSSVAAVTEDVNVVGGQLSTSGAVTISDIDSGDNSFQPTAVFNGAGSALGTLVFNTNGTYSYAVDNSKVQYLKTGESVVETYTVTSKDGSATTTITITINGADDGAVITPGQPGDDLGSVTEDGQLTAGGKLNVVDPDAGQAVFVAQNNVPTDYGNFTIGTDGTWSYNLDNNNPAVQALGAGQTLTETRTVVTADGTTANVVITINGTNDLPVLGSSVAAVTEDVNVVGGQLSTSGAVTISDIDSGDNSFQSTAVFNGTGSALGTLVFNTNGTYSYAVDNSKVQYLKTGESVVETYTVTSKDGSATTTITITINGADDGAVITPNVPNGDLGSVTEDGQLTAGGKLNVVDPDAGQAVFVAQNNVPTNYGNFTIGTDGTWSYNLDNNNPAVQALGAGQTLTETRTVVTADGTTANVVITINGTNDLPVLGSSVAAVTEDVNVVGGQLSTSGAVTISDIDSGDNSFQPTAVFNGAGSALGTLVFNTNGTYSYAVDNSKVQYLKTGESVVETYTVTSKDGSATTTITITINGADDGAVITPGQPGDDLGSVTEDGQLTAGGKLNVVDPDAGQAVFVAQNNVPTDYGNFTIGTDGTWSYNLDNNNPAVQALGAGQTLTETRTVVTADGTTANVVITINGTNDVPVLGSSVAAVTEDVNVVGGQLSTSGAVTISDIDSGDNSFQPTAVFNGAGSALGTLVFNTNGTYSYAVDNSKVQYLKTGESVVETYTVTSKDGSATTTITITINGADDGAVITPGQPGDDLGSVTEDGQLTAGGKLNVVDPDAGQAVFVAQNVATPYGQFTIGTDGTWSYNLDNNNPAVQALGAGQTLTETRTVVTADGTTANVVITINGTNDLPVLGSSVAAVTEDVNVVGGQLSTSGAVTISDIDSGDNSFQSTAVFNGTGSALGTLVFNTNGTYSYAVDNSKVQYLKTGESVVETYTVTSKDGSATTTITITINGADDGAVITPGQPGDDLGSVTEDGQLTAGGKLNVVDPDAGQAVFVAQNVATPYGQFTIGTDGTWSYNLDNNNPAVQALGAGQTLTETRTVVTADGTTANVVITINGTNDLPVLGSSVAAVTEDVNVVGGQLSTSGAVTISDIDSGDNSFQPTAVFNGAGTALGTLVFNTNGTYSYAVDNSKVQYLKTGESVVETYTVTSKDGSATTTITITINGADDGAVITPGQPGDDLGSVTEDGQLTAGGKLNVVDPDAGQAVFVAQNNVPTNYGNFTIGTDGTWSYNLDNNNPAVQALGAGQTLTETRTVVTADGTTANVVITINGTNDVPVLGSSVAAVTEDVNVVGGQLSTSGAVTISDIDSGDNSFQPTAVFNGAGTALGTLVFNTNGTYSYAVDNSKVQYLKTGESVVETYTVTSKDGSATTTITITINGADDGAVITPNVPNGDLGSVTEDGQLTAGGKLNVVDPDAGQAVFVAQNNVPTDYGNFTIGTDGTWSYNLDNNNPAVQALGAGQTLTETRTVVTADGTTANVVITINGTNDLPVLGSSVAAVTEDVNVVGGQLSTSGAVTISDIDSGDNSFQATAVFNGTGSALGTLVFNTNGTYSYAVDNSKVQYLKTGESVVETYTVTSKDGSATTTITITINGADDGAVITPGQPGDDLGSVTEDGQLTAGGKLNVVDPDAGQAVFVAQNNVPTDYGNFTIGTDGTWSYNLDNNNPAVQALGAGQTLTETRTVVTADGTTANVVITINGTNDLPVLGSSVAAVTEDVNVVGGQLSTSGAVTISDIDSGDNSFQPTAVFNGAGTALGTLVFNTNGTYSYAVDNSKVQYLKTGESVVETYTVTSKDGSATTTITITINGADDGAVITPSQPNGDLGSVTEDGQLTAGGKLNVVDPDAGQAVFVAQNNVPTDYGNFTIGTDGTWSYNLDNNNPAVQALGAGQTLTETRTVVTADGTTANVVITVNGTNDVPVLGSSVAAVTEDINVVGGQLSTSGAVTISDIDSGDNSFQPTAVFNGAGTALGTLVFNTNGTYSYAVDNSKVQYLKTGESVVETYTVTSKDGSATTTITITINGADDGAQVTPAQPGSDAGSVKEDDTLTTGGKLNVTDPDANQAAFNPQTNAAGNHGSFSIDANGNWTYGLNNDDAAVQALGKDETLTETFEVTTIDGTKATVTVTINGTNDAPVLSGVLSGTVTEDGAQTANGQLATQDTDANDTHTYTVVGNATGTYGSFAVDANGQWTYTLDNAKAQELTANDTRTETYTVQVSDGKGGLDTKNITVSIKGSNDGAQVTPAQPGSDAGSVKEDDTLTTGGKLNVTDPDANQAAFNPVTAKPGNYGSFSIDANGNWTYGLNNDDAAVQALGKDETLTETFEVTTIDGTKATVTVTINGTNDAPVLSGVLSGTVTEDGAQTANGQLTTQDTDAKDTHTYTVVGNATGTYGSFAVDANGQWTYTLDNAKAQELTANDTRTETYTVQVSDGKGGLDTKNITVSIKGSNDGAQVTPAQPGSDAGSVKEDDTLTTGGKLNVTDPDANQAAFNPQTNAAGNHGSFSIDANGNWTYGLNNSDAAVQALGKDETLTETFEVTTIDGTKATVTVTINGTNDAPVLSGVLSGTVTEDGAQTANGQLTTQDTDANDTHTYTVVGNATGTYGSFAVDANGQWTYTLDNAKAQELTANDTRTETYTVQVSDGKGGLDTKNITVSIKGSNDGAQVTPAQPGSDAGSVKEDDTLTTGGKLNVTDPDAGQAAFNPQTNAAGNHGSFSIDANGNWTYGLNNDDAAVQALGKDETLTETFEVTTIDGTKATVTVTINGTNDAPVLSGVLSGTVTEDGAQTANGQLTTQDTDAKDTHTYTVVGNATGTYGSFAVDANGQWTYTLDNAKAQELTANDTRTETYTVQVSDGKGGLDTKNITVSIKGSNDGAQVTPAQPGSDAGSVKEDDTLTTGGKLNVTDPDANQAAFNPQTNAAGNHGSFSIDANGNWTYGLNNDDAAVQALGKDETLTETFEVTTIDGTKATVTVTINGTNDTPVLSGVLSGTVTEDGAQTANGQLTTQDTDANDTHTYTVVGNATGTYGSFAVDANGQWTYTLDNAKAQELTANDTRTETYTVQVSDGKGGLDTKNITVSIKGSNDGAQVTPAQPGSDAGSVKEDDTLTTGGKLNVTDPDANQAAFNPQTNAAGNHGSFSIDANGNWTYGLNNSDAAVQALGKDETLTETFEVTTIDGTKATVTVTINGTNDAPVLSGVLSGTVTEDGAQTANGQLTTQDTDANDTHAYTVVGNATGTYGSFTVDANGQWTYTLDNAKAQELTANDTRTETYTVQVSDGKGGLDTKNITVSIKGANDGAVVTPANPDSDKGSVTEDGQLTTGGKLNVVDPDANQAAFTPVTGQAGNHGSFNIDANGNWTYALNNSDATVQALGEGEKLYETFEVTTIDGTKATVTVTINGTNDVPKITGNAVGTVTEDGTTTANGTLASTDADKNATLTWSVDNSGTGTYGRLTVDATGKWTYVLDNASTKVQELAAGQVVNDTILVRVTDDKGASTTQAVVITINGANDGANITGNGIAVLKEDTKTDASGKLNVADADAGEAYFIVQSDVSVQYGQFTISRDGNWNYRLNNNDPVIQQLREGQTLTETVTVRTVDGTLAQIAVTITGTNDKPQLSQADRALTEDANAAGGVLTTVGSLTITDVDAGEAKFQTGAVLTKVEGTVLTANAALGTLTFNADGSYRYSVDNSKVAYLKNGESVVETYTVTSFDGTTTSTIVIRIQGADSGAVVSPATPDSDKGAVTEDVALTTGGKLNVVDADAGQSVFVVQTNVTGNYGTFSIDKNGNWTYALNNSLAAVQALGAGKTLTDTREVTTADGTKANVVITIKGTNDVPTLGTGVSALTEDANVSAGKLSTSGSVSILDKDTDESSFQANAVYNGTGTALGTLVFNTNGSYSYSVDNSKVQYLQAGEKLLEQYTVTSKDGSASTTITITITGANDAPTLSGAVTGSVKEDVTTSVSGKLTVTDVDVKDTHTWTVNNSGKGQYGSFTVDATGKWTYVLDNASTKVQALTEGQKVTDTINVTVDDGKGGTAVKTITVDITGTNEAPVAQAVTGTAPEDNMVTIILRGTDVDGSVKSFQLTSLAANGTFYSDSAGKNVLTTQEIAAANNSATIYFKPNKDWSGTTTFNYTAKDAENQVSTNTATGTITVTPVADTPVVKLTVGAGSNPVTTVIDTTTVKSTNTGHTVTANDADGKSANVSVIKGTNHDGFGVSGGVSSNGGAASEEIAGNGSKSESLTIAFKVPVTKITVQFAWLASSEQARYTLYDEAGKVIGTPQIIQGKTDTVEEQFTLTVPVGTTIGKIVFDAPRNGDDYLVHKVTYTTATTYPLTITADPRDIDFSETITKVVVEVPVGVTLSAGTQIDATHWSVPLVSNGSYSVSVDGTTKAVTITGLNMTVPENVSVGEVKVVATATDGSSTADASYTYHGVPVANDDTASATLTSRSVAGTPTQTTLANFGSGETNAWKFDNSTNTYVDKSDSALSNVGILAYHQDKWMVTSLTSSGVDASRSNGALVLTDRNGVSSGDAKMVTPVYTVDTEGTKLQFKVTAVSNLNGDQDSAGWALYKSTNGSSWSEVQTGSISSTGTITTGALSANAMYRIGFMVHEGHTSGLSAAVSFDDFLAVVPGASVIEWSSSAINGSVTANDTRGTLGETADLSVLVGSTWINATTAGTTVNGSYGTLVIKSDGSYSYTPTASAAGAGKVDHFEYKLTQADGDFAKADLDISINATGPGAAASSRMALSSTLESESSHEVHSTSGSDTLLGTAEDDLFVWHQGDAGTSARPVTDVVKNFGSSGNDSLDLSDLLQGEESSTDLSKFLHLETKTEADGKTVDTVIKVSTAGGLDADGNGFNQQILIEGVNLTTAGHDQNSMIKDLIDQGKLKIDHS